MSRVVDSVQLVLDAMRATFGAEFTTYYDGDPEAIPVFNLPALIVTQTSDETTEGAMGQDDVTDQITIKLVLNKRDDFTTTLDPLNTTERRLRDYVGKKSRETGLYQERTVKHALRNNIALQGITAIANSMNVEYGLTPRVGLTKSNTQEELLTAEAHVTFGIQYAVDTL